MISYKEFFDFVHILTTKQKITVVTLEVYISVFSIYLTLIRLMSNREILCSLRQLQFPDCVRVAVDYLAFVGSHESSNSSSFPAYAVEPVSDQIVSDFIFSLHGKKVSTSCKIV